MAVTVDMWHLLELMVSRGAPALHRASGSPPRLRVDGALAPLAHAEALTPPDTARLAYGLLSDAQKRQFEETQELDFAFGIDALGRLRCILFTNRVAVGAAV